MSEYYPDYYNTEKITINQLLNHNNGLKDLLTLPDVLLISTTHTDKLWNPHKIAETILNKKLIFTPGTDNQYSNSNYLLLGLIAEKVTGKKLDILFSEYLFTPNNISGISFNPTEKAPNELISDYDRNLLPNIGWYELTRENTAFSSNAFASGNLVSNSEQTALFFHKLFHYEIITQNSLD